MSPAAPQPASESGAPSFRVGRHLPLLVPLLVSLLALLLTDHALDEQEQERRSAAFATHANKLHERLRERMRSCDNMLRGAAGLFASSQHVTRAEWASYVSALALDDTQVGVQGIGFASYLKADALPRHESQMQQDGFPGYAVVPAGERPAYGVIVYIEPFQGRNLRAFGFDMLSERTRSEAMLRARDAAEITYSGRVTLVQESGAQVQAGVLAYLPVYEGGQGPRTLAQRRASFKGWVYSPFRMGDLLNAVFQEDLRKIRVQVIDRGTDGRTGDDVLFDSHGDAFTGLSRVSLPMQLSGRHWLVHYDALPDEQALSQGGITRTLTLLGVGALGFLLCTLTWFQVTNRERVRAQVQALSAEVADRDERFRLMVEGVRDYAILMLDEHGHIMSWSVGAERIKGWRADEIIGRHFSCFYTQEARSQGLPDQALATALVTGQYRNEGWRVRKDGSLFRASVLITAVRDAAGHIKGFAKVTRDITEHHQQQERLRLAATVFRATQEGVAITDAQARVMAVNPAFERITEYRESDVKGHNLRLLASGRHDRAFFEQMWADLLAKGSWQGEIWNRRKGGEIHASWLTIDVVRDENDAVTNHVAVYTDVTRIAHVETQMERMAHHDSLTELPNRLLLQSRLEHTLERSHRSGRICAVLFLDLDRFKEVNDGFGHEAGDELLKAVAKRLHLHLRENDTVARLGGDEFVIVLEDLTSAEGAEVVAKAVIERMQQPFALSCGHDAHIGCSVGIALSPQDGRDGETLLRHADAALYQAKAAGRGAYRFFRADD